MLKNLQSDVDFFLSLILLWISLLATTRVVNGKNGARPNFQINVVRLYRQRLENRPGPGKEKMGIMRSSP